MTVTVVFAFAAVGIAGVLVAERRHSETPLSLGDVVLRDSFDRAPSRAGLGGGWADWIGTWHVVDGRASLAAPARAEAAPPFTVRPVGLSVIATPPAAHAFGVTMAPTHANCGVAFGIRDANNFSALVAQPATATWNVLKVENGLGSFVRNTGVRSVRDGTRVVVEREGGVVRIDIEQMQTRFADPAPSATGVGLVAFDGGCVEAQWENVEFTR